VSARANQIFLFYLCNWVLCRNFQEFSYLGLGGGRRWGFQFSVCTCRRRSPRIRNSEKFCTRKKPVAAGALSCHANESVNWSSAVRPREQWFFFGEKSPNGDTVFWKRNIPSQIPCFLEKNSPKSDRKLVFWGMVSPHLCLLATVFRVSWNKLAS
jgi:hypothetical protein